MKQTTEDLRDLYDWGNESVFFRRCGEAFDGEQGYCFSEAYAKQINWQAMKISYEKEKKDLDKYLNEYRKSLKQKRE